MFLFFYSFLFEKNFSIHTITLRSRIVNRTSDWSNVVVKSTLDSLSDVFPQFSI